MNKLYGIIICTLLITISISPAIGLKIQTSNDKNIKITAISNNNLEICLEKTNIDDLGDSTYTIYEGLHWTLTVTAYWTPPQPDKQICIWADTETLPEGATFPECTCGYGEVSAVLDWTPSEGQAGTYVIIFLIGEYCYEAMGTHTVTVHVLENEPDPTNSYEIYEGQNWHLTVTSYWTPPQPERPICLWVDETTLPDGASFTPSCHCDYGQVSSDLYWTPAFCQAGTYAITFFAGETCGEYVFPFVIEVRVFSNFVYNLEFKQLNWYNPDGELVSEDSVWGYVEFDYEPDSEDTYYFNLKASSNLGGGSSSWVVKNMPLFPNTKNTLRLGAFINLEELGIYSGTDINKVYLALKASKTILTSPPTSPFEEYNVEDLDRKANNDVGSPDMTEPFTNPGKPDGTKNVGATTTRPADRDINPVQEDRSQCFPGSVARSLDWLNREFDLDIDKEADDFYDEVKDEVDNNPETSVNAQETWKISKKNDYAKQVSGNKIVTKVYDAINFVDPIDGVDEKTPTNETLFDFLKREFNDEDEDVEIAFYSSRIAHIVTVVNVYETSDGKFMLRYRDDETQGNDDEGDSGIKEVEIKKLADGRYTFGSNRFVVWYAMSESVVEDTNDPPETPAQPEGPETGETGETQSYETVTTDPDGDQVSYGWDWDGNNIVDGWTTFYDSGEEIVANHIFTSKGTYEIKVKAKDTHGAESGWSDPLSVEMPKTKLKSKYLFFARFWEILSKIFECLN